jgi:hypothetical protein
MIVDNTTGLVFFISAIVMLLSGLALVYSKRATHWYMVYRIVPLAGFFGAFGLAIISGLPGGVFAQAGIAGAQTLVIMIILHVFIGRHLRR